MILNDIAEIRTIIEECFDYNLNIRTSYKLMKFLSETENDYNFFITKTQEIINKYALKDENNQIISDENGIKINEQFIENVKIELMDLSLIEVEIGNYFYFTLDELEGLNMSCRKIRPFIPYIRD